MNFGTQTLFLEFLDLHIRFRTFSKSSDPNDETYHPNDDNRELKLLGWNGCDFHQQSVSGPIGTPLCWKRKGQKAGLITDE